MQTESTQKVASKFGMSLSLLCAVHCLAMPFVISFLPFASTYIGHHEIAESSMLGGSLLLAGMIFRKDYKNIHGKYLPSIILSLGFGISIFSNLIHESHALSALAGLLIFAAYLINWKFNSSHQACLHTH